MHEASVLKTLQHPYVVRYKESFLEDGWLCIVQEYCEGGDMYQRIQKAKKQHQPFSESQIVTWFTQCMMGLKFIHEKKILHRDLKSSNFFRTENYFGQCCVPVHVLCTSSELQFQLFDF